MDRDYRDHIGCMRAIIWTGIAIFVFFIILMCCTSCKTQCVPELIETHDTVVKLDSVYIERVRDSIVYKERQDSVYEYEKDSVSIKERNDTVWITNWKDKYKYEFQSTNATEQTTTANTQTSEKVDKEKNKKEKVVVKTERYIPKFYKFTMWFFWIIVVLALIRIAIWVMDKIPATKPYIAVLKKFVPFL